MSEVPLGALLSGGIDSSAVVALMAQQVAEPVKTFSISFGEADFDETRFARMVAERYATEHHELRVEPDALSILPRLARHHGEPFADPSAIPSFHLAELTGRHVTVALNGDGGDEAFAGYDRYARMVNLQRLRRAPRALRAAVAGLARIAGPGRGQTTPRSRLRLLGQSLNASELEAYEASVLAFDSDRRRRLLAPDLVAELDGWRAESLLESRWADVKCSGLDRFPALDVETYLPGDLLTKMDIATMAHSVEARSPFLDHHVMELAARLPAELRLRAGAGKHVLRAALRGAVPDEILDRPKMGFGVPLRHWFRADLRDLPRELLLDPAAQCRRYLDTDEVERLLAEHAGGRYDRALRIWSLVMFETWHREVLEPASTARARAASGR
jgi:asparagine synthase (glutamine-hydrolysing)